MTDTPNPTAQELAARLAEERAVMTVQRHDMRERKRLDVEHRDLLAEVDALTVTRKRSRRERDREEVESAALTELYRKATRSGVRARIRADIQRSAEMRALRVSRVRSATLWVGLPVLLALGGWSTAGVQAGVVKLIGYNRSDAGWWMAWLMEPALLTIVASIIIARAILRSSGGDTDRRAAYAEWLALGTSIALNMAGGWVGTGFAALGAALAHSVGPLGAAGVAFLIGLFDSYVKSARPWEGAPRIADLDFTPPPSQATPASVAATTGSSIGHADDLTAVVDATAPTTAELVEQAVTRHLGELEAAPAAEPPRPRLRPSTPRISRRTTRRAPAIHVTVETPATPRRTAGEQPAPKAAKTRTSAAGRGRPSAAQKVTNFAARNPDLTPAEMARRLGVSADTVRRHLPAPAVNGHKPAESAN